MIVDVHGHTTAPPELYAFNYSLLQSRGDYGLAKPQIGDERIAAALKGHLSLLREAGTDLQLIAPRPWGIPNAGVPERLVRAMTEAANDLIARQVALHPDTFRGLAGLPQCTGVSPGNCVDELRRCVEELGFVGCMINPDPGEGDGQTPPMGDEHWYPLYEQMVALDVPGLVHGGSYKGMRESQGSHFITEESIAALSLAESRVFRDFPGLKLIIGHGGGSVPYQIGRARSVRAGRQRRDPDLEGFDESLRRLYFDTVLYNQESLELLFRVAGTDRCLFGTDRPGTGSSLDPATGRAFDDLRPLVEGIPWLTETDRRQIFEDNARKVFTRLTV
jgi:predicted TIM-barrel fold metal-dependent hydrolase